jgi:putative ABC transport system permease protein
MLTLMICVVAGLSILVSIYNSMSERRQEIAVMRALGASRTTISRIVLTESTLLSLGGGLGGWILGHLLIGLLAGSIEAYTGVTVSMFDLSPALAIPVGERIIELGVSAEILFVPGLIVLGAAVGFFPAFAAYQVDVARSLQP